MLFCKSAYRLAYQFITGPPITPKFPSHLPAGKTLCRSQEKYPQTKKKTRRTVHQKGKDLRALCIGMIRNVIAFKIAKGMVKTHQDIIGEMMVY